MKKKSKKSVADRIRQGLIEGIEFAKGERNDLVVRKVYPKKNISPPRE